MINDRLNPIVVKELRQGLKSRSFLISFVGLQLAMIISMFIYITSSVSRYGGNLSEADAVFWSILSLLLLLLMPLRSFQALNDEIKNNTLELIFLTRMSAWKISLGKWIAHAIQAVLMASAVLPYFVLRYFLGSINISLDLFVLAIIIGLGLVTIAIGVGLSAWQSKILRILVMVGGVFGGCGLLIALFESSSMGSSGFSFDDIDIFWLIVLLVGGILAILYFVEYGAAQIAPPAENHAAPKRLIGLVLTAMFALAAYAEGESIIMFVSLFALGPFLFIPTLCEPLYAIPTLYRKGKRLNPLRWLFYPGWASGLLFNFLLFGIIFTTTVTCDSYIDEDIIWFFISLFNTCFMPFIFIRLIPKLQEKALLAYLGMQLAGLLTGMMFLVLDDINLISRSVVGAIGIFIPVVGLILSGSSNGWEPFAGGHMLMSAVIAGACLYLSLPGFRAMKRMQKTVSNEPA